METKVIKKEQPTSKEELGRIAKDMFGYMVKAVVDVEQGIMAVGGQMHADGLTVLMEQENSTREHTWEINIYPEKLEGDDWLEFDSMVNLKPWLDNRTRGVENADLRKKIKEIILALIVK